MSVEIVACRPTVGEFAAVTAAVGFKAQLLAEMRTLSYTNVLVEAPPLPSLERFYERFGTAPRRPAPGMHL